MKKSTKRYLYGLIIVTMILFIQQTNFLPFLFSDFSSDSITIRDQKKVLEQLYAQRSILTQEAEEEIILDSVKPNSKDQYVILAKGKIKAGIDVRLLNEADIYIDRDSIAIQLPPAEILEMNINPSNYSIIEQKGSWTNDEIIIIKSKAKKRLEQNAQSGKILGRAEIRGIMIIEGLLRADGFTKITLL